MMASSKIQSQDDCKVESLKFGYNLTISLSQLLVKHCLCDTTLVTSDGTLSAHRVILAASSGFFQSVFSLPSLHQTLHPVIYLRNIKTVHMRSILHFLYTGVANVSEDDVDQFIKIATDLKIEGLMMENNKRGRKKKTKTSLNDEKTNELKAADFYDGNDESLLEKLREKYSVKPICLDSIEDNGVVSDQDSFPDKSSTPPLLSRNNVVKRPRKRKPVKHNDTNSTSKPMISNSTVPTEDVNETGVVNNDFCPMCNVRVGAGGLKQHMDTSGTGDLAECHDCHKTFVTCSSLYEHKRGNCVFPPEFM